MTRSRSSRARIVALTIVVGTACGPRDVGPAGVGSDARATILVHVIALDGAPLSSAFVTAKSPSGGADSVSITATGSIDRGLVAVAGDSVEIRIDMAEPRTHYASVGRVAVRRDTAIDVVLLPTSWTVRNGRYRGSRRAIDLVKAIGSDEDDTNFLNHAAPARGIFAGWPEDALPIAVGIDSTGASRRWSAADSAWFWQSLDDFNEAVGRRVFRPVGEVAHSTEHVIGVRIDFERDAIAYGSLGANLDVCRLPSRSCSDVRGVVSVPRGLFFRSSFDAEFFRLFQHEMMHALGFGHGCYWSSVMMHTGPVCSPDVPHSLTVDDVAYIELVFRLATTLKAHPEAWNVDEALSAIRR